VIGAGFLDPAKARILMALLLMSEAGQEHGAVAGVAFGPGLAEDSAAHEVDEVASASGSFSTLGRYVRLADTRACSARRQWVSNNSGKVTALTQLRHRQLARAGPRVPLPDPVPVAGVAIARRR
jgi:hypothetical protein